MKKTTKKSATKTRTFRRTGIKVSVVTEKEMQKRFLEKMNPRSFKKTFGIFFAACVFGFVVLNLNFFLEKLKGYFGPKVYVEYSEENLSLRAVRPQKEPNTFIISALNINAPIVYATSTEEKSLQQSLEQGVVHYTGTAEVGQVGNAYIFGHSSDFVFKKGEYKSVFARLPEIKTGEYITVTDRQGYEYIYKVYETLVVEADDVSVLSQSTNGRKILSLQTSYPIGTALKRFLVRAEMLGE